jgi:hypothetical protein
MHSIRMKCVECCEGRLKEVRECPATSCPLHPYRMGKNPSRRGIGNKNAMLNLPHKNRQVAKNMNEY